jgi:hypothetical protein
MESTYVGTNSRDVGVSILKAIPHLLKNGLQKAIQYPCGNRLNILLYVSRYMATVLVAEIMGIDCTFRNGFPRGAWISYSNVCGYTIKSAGGSKSEKERRSDSSRPSFFLPACNQQRRLEAWQGRKVDLGA